MLAIAVAALRFRPGPPVTPIPVRAARPGSASERPGFLGGTIDRGACSAQTNVCAQSDEGSFCQVTNQGRFLFEVPPGTYHILGVCDQGVAEHVGELYVAAGERIDGLIVGLQPSGAIGLQVELPPNVEDEEFVVRTDPPIHNAYRPMERFEPGGPLERPLPVAAGKVHVRARGRCLSGDADVEVEERIVTRLKMRLEAKPCDPLDPKTRSR